MAFGVGRGGMGTWVWGESGRAGDRRSEWWAGDGGVLAFSALSAAVNEGCKVLALRLRWCGIWMSCKLGGLVGDEALVSVKQGHHFQSSVSSIHQATLNTRGTIHHHFPSPPHTRSTRLGVDGPPQPPLQPFSAQVCHGGAGIKLELVVHVIRCRKILVL